MGEYIYSGETGIYTGERDVQTEYLIQGSVSANYVKTQATFTNQSDKVDFIDPISNIQPGDIIRNDKDTVFYTIKSVSADSKWVQLTDKYAGETYTGSATIKKERLGSAAFEYVRSLNEYTGAQNIPYNENKIFFDENKIQWGITGTQYMGPISTPTGLYTFPEDDVLNVKFQASATSTSPAITAVRSGTYTLVNDNKSTIADLPLNAIPYPHESLKVYWGKVGGIQTLKEENVNYVVNYTQNPEYTLPFPPQEERQVGFIKFLEEITQKQLTIDENFDGNLNVIKVTDVPGSKDLQTPITNIVQDTEVITVGTSRKFKNYDYSIDYGAGIVTFGKHVFAESIVNSVGYPKSLLWDGVSIIEGVDKDKLTGETLVIPGISGLQGITGVVYFEDTIANNLEKDTDYTLEYDSGSIDITQPPATDKALLVSYYVEGEDEENESLLKKELRTKKFPLMAGTVVLTKVWTNAENKDVTKVLDEGVDFKISYLTGKITPLAESLIDPNIKRLNISYTPMALMNNILQKDSVNNDKYRMTLYDDILDIEDSLALKFKIKNPLVSTQVSDPFKVSDDPSKVTYDGTIDELLSVKILHVDGTTSELVLDGYKYDDLNKELTLDQDNNELRPDKDKGDKVLAVYTFLAEKLPYAPVEAIFPFFEKGANSFVIEGYDRTDVLAPDMVIRIDNFDPEASYYFKIASVEYDGDSTNVVVYGSFTDQIRNPSFYLFDTAPVFVTLPDGTTVNRAATIGTDQVIFSGNLLQLKEAIRDDCLLMINGADIYTVQTATIVEDTLVASIFPKLQRYISGDVYVSQNPITEEGATDLSSVNPIIVTPEEPAFTLRFNNPTQPVELEGYGTIVIDTEKILLYEHIGVLKNPDPYVYFLKNYTSIYGLAKDIQSTVSNFVPETTYQPFTISYPETGTEDYYFGAGDRNTDLIIPFEQQVEQTLPYTVIVRPDLFKWSVPLINKDTPYFVIDRVDQTSGFSSGQLIAVQSKVTNDRYYHVISGSSYAISSRNDGTSDTTVSIKDKFRINFIDPYIYKYDYPVWNNLYYRFSVSKATSEITFYGNISDHIGPSYFLKFENNYLYKIESVTFNGTNTVVKLSPSITNIKPEYYPGYVQITSIPIYIDGPTHQPYVDVVYTAPKSHTGHGTVEITYDELILNEFLDGSSVVSKTSTLKFSDYTDTYELLYAINSVSSNIAGSYPFTANVEAYKDTLKNGGYSVFQLVPTYGDAMALPYRVYVMEKTFSVNYTLSSGYTGKAYIKKEDGKFTLKEVINDGGDDQTATYVVLYTSKTPFQIFDEINNTESTITGDKSFSVTTFSSPYDPSSFFMSSVYPAFQIPSTYWSGFEELPNSVGATVTTATWDLLGPLNVERLIAGTDYEVEGASVVVNKAVVRRDRFILNYFGLDNLSEFENLDITVFCRFFSVLPVGNRVNVYMDFLNVDQFYVQKLTEQKFLEIVTVPQVGELLVQKGGGGGIGSDFSSNSKTENYQGGNANMYYLLRDEQIKKILYLKLYEWYKHRLRYFASEAQLITGFKYGHSTHYYTYGSYYTLLDSAVEGQGDYELTTADDIKQIDRGFSKFFPIGYDDAAPKYYDRFSVEYLNYTNVYCYNFKYYKNTGTVTDAVWKQLKIDGKVRSTKPYWAPKEDNLPSDLDHKILQSAPTTVVPGYTVAFDSEETTFDSNNSTYSFLKRVTPGDKIKIDKRDTYYVIGSIKNRPTEYNPSDQGQSLAETLLLEEGAYFGEDNVKTYSLYEYDPVGMPGQYYYKIRMRAGFFSAKPPSDDGIPSGDSNGYYTIWKSEANFENSLGTIGFKIWIKKQDPETFPTYNDEGNYGVSLFSDSIRGQKKNTDKIKKPLTFADIFKILFPVQSLFVNLEPDKNFRSFIGSYNELTNDFIIGSFNNSTNIFTGKAYDEENTNINLKNLTFFEERRVSDTLEALNKDLKYQGSIGSFEFYQPYKIDPDVDGKNPNGPKYYHGLHRYFDIDFERNYKYQDPDGYIDAVVFRTINRDTWFQFREETEEDVTSDYGVKIEQLYKGFYDPNNLYLKLLLEKQALTTEEDIIHDIYDVPRKLSRAFKDGVLNAGNETVDSNGSPTTTIAYPAYQGYLTTVGTAIKVKMENYVNLLAFILRPDAWDIGPVCGILQEDALDASDAIATSYAQAEIARSKYTDFFNKSFNNSDSFYKLNDGSLAAWTYVYARWVLSLTEGTIYQLQAKDQLETNSYITAGYLPVDGISLFFNTNATEVSLTDCTSAMVFDFISNSYGISLFCNFAYPNDGISGVFSKTFTFSEYKTIGELVHAINTNSYPGGKVFFSSVVNFEHYPYEDLSTYNLIYYASISIPTTGLMVSAANVADHRKHDARILYLTKGVYDRIVVEQIPAVEVFPTYVAYYNDPTDSESFAKINPKKSAINGLKVPGNWQESISGMDNVISVRSITPNNFITPGTLSVTFSQQYDPSMAVSDYLYANIIIDPKSKDSLDELKNFVKVIDTTTPPDNGTIPIIKDDIYGTYSKLTELNYGNKPEVPLIKTIAFTITKFGISSTFVLNARKYKTIGDMVDVLNRHFYKDDNGYWTPEEDASADLSDPKYVKLFHASIPGGNVTEKRAFSPLDLNFEYVRLIRTFFLYDPNRNLDPKENFTLGWIPASFNLKAGEPFTIGIRQDEYYSPSYLYNFVPLKGKQAADSSLAINSNHPNKNILPFDLYSLDSTYRIASNILYLASDSILSYEIPLSGALGHPELDGETLGQLVDRINNNDDLNTIFYANLKFLRRKNKEGYYGYFEYTYLPDQGGTIPQATKETLYLAPDSNVMTLSAENSDGAQYQMVEGATPGRTAELDIQANVRVMSIAPNGADYTITTPLYKIDQIAGQLGLSCGYSRRYSYEVELDFNTYTTIGSLNSAINSIIDPVHGQTLYNSLASFPATSSYDLATTSLLYLTAYLKRKNFSTVLLRVRRNNVIHPNISYTSATCRVTGSKIILTANVVYSGTFSIAYGLSNTITSISASVNSSTPGSTTIFPSLFTSEVIASGYASYLGTSLTATGVVMIPLGAGVFAYILATRSYSTGATLLELVESINLETAFTGVTAGYAFTADPGYKNINAEYLIPSPATYTPFTSVIIGADFSSIPAMYLLKMDTLGAYSIVDNKLNVATNTLGFFSYSLPADKDLHGWIDSISGNFSTNLRSIDVLPIKIDGIPYGSLNTKTDTNMVGNPPTNVFFGVLGDIRFYQISDANLYNQLSIIKRRLAEPWRNPDGTVINPDYYNDQDFYESFKGNSADPYDFGNVHAIYKTKFLDYIKTTRFKQLKESINEEQLINNKYLWLYLKFHKEMGCDQRVKAYFKKIKTDESDTTILPQD
jgi:hypothetical protein